jgi:hypothetical protein
MSQHPILIMRHARPDALDKLEDMMVEVRKHSGLTERKRGAFYLKSSGFLHFHEDPAGLFADLKIDGRFERFPVSTAAQQQRVLQKIADLLSKPGVARRR